VKLVSINLQISVDTRGKIEVELQSAQKVEALSNNDVTISKMQAPALKSFRTGPELFRSISIEVKFPRRTGLTVLVRRLGLYRADREV